MDLEKFFDRVNHDILMSRIARRVKDKRILLLIRLYLQAGMLEGGTVSQRVEGTPQGGPLSPLLSNVLLDDLDRELERRGHRFVRYADDCNVYVRSRRAGERVLGSIEHFLWRRLRLAVNRDKSAGDRPSRRKFLGYTVTAQREARLRCILWRQWKRPRTRAKRLMKLGLDRHRAFTSAYNGHGPWWNAGASHMNQAVPTRFFRKLGLLSLIEEHRRLQCQLRTAVYGTVRTVV